MLNLDKPENLYQLCEMVCEQIATTPKNYVQQRYATVASSWNEESCGTAFCRAGWMVNILDHSAGITRTTDEWVYNTLISLRSEQLFMDAGFDSADMKDVTLLFNGGACSMHNIGSPEYVREGIDGLRRFMAKHEDKLKAARIVGTKVVKEGPTHGQ